MEKCFNWCFIGAGTLAGQVARQIRKSGRHRVVSVYTRSFEKGRAFGAKYGCEAYATAQEAICAAGVDGVYVVTPHNSHYAYAKLALELGKPVLMEKPFTMNAREARELFALAREKGVYIAEAMWTWFSPVAHQVKTWLDAGELGQLESTAFCYHLDSRKYAARVTDPHRAGGALLDVGVYPITYIYRLFGKPDRVECTGVLAEGIDLGEEVKLSYPDGREFTASVSIADFKGLEHLRLTGQKGSIRCMFFHATNRVRLKRKGGKSETFRGRGDYLNEFDRAAEEIREGLAESRLVPSVATVEVMDILDECRRQMDLVYPFERQ